MTADTQMGADNTDFSSPQCMGRVAEGRERFET